MPSTAVYKCQCGKDFTARTADRKRGWARFCSKRCKAIEQESRTHQYRDFIQRKEYSESQSDAGLDGLEDGWDGHKNAF